MLAHWEKKTKNKTTLKIAEYHGLAKLTEKSATTGPLEHCPNFGISSEMSNHDPESHSYNE